VIRQHDFNTQWWGRPVGIVDDAAFFTLPAAEQAKALVAFQWVEFKCLLKDAPPLLRLRDAGFFLADSQMDFRIGLKFESKFPCPHPLEVRCADTEPFTLSPEDVRSFENERYQHLPGQYPELINRRYIEWGRQLIRDHPGLCFELVSGAEVQGWFLSRPANGGLNLTLAMLHRSARISGFHLYQRSIWEYGRRGHRIGWAGFSVTNTAILNIYSALGARFNDPMGVWLWCGPSSVVAAADESPAVCIFEEARR
jgi:hypothetical protein